VKPRELCAYAQSRGRLQEEPENMGEGGSEKKGYTSKICRQRKESGRHETNVAKFGKEKLRGKAPGGEGVEINLKGPDGLEIQTKSFPPLAKEPTTVRGGKERGKQREERIHLSSKKKKSNMDRWGYLLALTV